jgi:hypothetical protein
VATYERATLANGIQVLHRAKGSATNHLGQEGECT